MSIISCRSILSAALVGAAVVAPATAQTATDYPVGKAARSAVAAATVAPPAAEPASPVPLTVQQARWQVLKPEVNSFYFQHMGDLFDTRVVPRSGPVWQLPRDDRKIAISYAWKGQNYNFDDFLDRTFTNALVVMKDGRIVTEIYRNRSNPTTHFISWSMAKSFTSTLVGFALADGRIASLDDPIDKYLPELKDGAYKGVTIRQILEMKSGVDYEERYDFDNPGVAARNHRDSLIKNITRFADVARTLKRKSAPGTTFDYKTIDTAVLGWLVERVTQRPAAHYMAEKLWEPLGAEDNGFFIMDGPPGIGREFTGGGYNAVARDYARFGQLMLNGGFANGHQIVPAKWVTEATRPADPEGERGGYGYQWWTVANSNAYYALGLEGQFIYIDPDTKTVIVKLSYFPGDDDEVYGEALAGLGAISRWSPSR